MEYRTVQAYPPTNICPGCSKPLNQCECRRNRYSADVVTELVRHTAHLHGAPGFNWADTLTLTDTGATA